MTQSAVEFTSFGLVWHIFQEMDIVEVNRVLVNVLCQPVGKHQEVELYLVQIDEMAEESLLIADDLSSTLLRVDA